MKSNIKKLFIELAALLFCSAACANTYSPPILDGKTIDGCINSSQFPASSGSQCSNAAQQIIVDKFCIDKGESTGTTWTAVFTGQFQNSYKLAFEAATGGTWVADSTGGYIFSSITCSTTSSTTTPLPPPPITPTTPLPPPPTTQSVFAVPIGRMPTAAVSVTPSGTFGNATLAVTLDLSQDLSGGSFAGLGQFASGYNIYVAALVPSGALGLLSTATWFVLPATHNWTLLSSPIAAYMEGLAQNATNSVAITVLQGTDVTALVGTELYIGYGTSDTEMLAANRYRGVYKVQ